MYKKYWTGYYKKQKCVHYPSPFAVFCSSNYLKEKANIFDLGTGNGRDAFYFAEKGHIVNGVDQCNIIISDNKEKSKHFKMTDILKFYCLDIATDDISKIFDMGITAVYSRFVFHAIPEDVEDRIIHNIYQFSPVNGMFFLEFRTDKDPLMSLGQEISDNERVTDHYRRFINVNNFLSKVLAIGFQIDYFCESKGLAVYGDEDPCVARYVMRKL